MEHLGQFIINHWLLCLTFTIALLLTLSYELTDLKKKAKGISPQTAIDKINNDRAVVIDLRDKEAYKQGHIIDSISATAADFEQAKMNKYKNKPLILVCNKGIQSQTIANKISALGYQALVLTGGLSAWQNEDLPLVK